MELSCLFVFVFFSPLICGDTSKSEIQHSSLGSLCAKTDVGRPQSLGLGDHSRLLSNLWERRACGHSLVTTVCPQRGTKGIKKINIESVRRHLRINLIDFRGLASWWNPLLLNHNWKWSHVQQPRWYHVSSGCYKTQQPLWLIGISWPSLSSFMAIRMDLTRAWDKCACIVVKSNSNPRKVLCLGENMLFLLFNLKTKHFKWTRTTLIPQWSQGG